MTPRVSDPRYVPSPNLDVDLASVAMIPGQRVHADGGADPDSAHRPQRFHLIRRGLLEPESSTSRRRCWAEKPDARDSNRQRYARAHPSVTATVWLRRPTPVRPPRLRAHSYPFDSRCIRFDDGICKRALAFSGVGSRGSSLRSTYSTTRCIGRISWPMRMRCAERTAERWV